MFTHFFRFFAFSSLNKMLLLIFDRSLIQVRRHLCDWFANLLRFVSYAQQKDHLLLLANANKKSSQRGQVMAEGQFYFHHQWLGMRQDGCRGWRRITFRLAQHKGASFFCGAQKEKRAPTFCVESPGQTVTLVPSGALVLAFVWRHVWRSSDRHKDLHARGRLNSCCCGSHLHTQRKALKIAFQ